MPNRTAPTSCQLTGIDPSVKATPAPSTQPGGFGASQPQVMVSPIPLQALRHRLKALMVRPL